MVTRPRTLSAAAKEEARKIYTSHVQCGNCGYYGFVQIDRGCPVDIWACPQCGCSGKLTATDFKHHADMKRRLRDLRAATDHVPPGYHRTIMGELAMTEPGQ